MKKKFVFPLTYLRHLSEGHHLSRKRYIHATISYIQHFNLDFISFGEDWKSFLSKRKENAVMAPVHTGENLYCCPAVTFHPPWPAVLAEASQRPREAAGGSLHRPEETMLPRTWE